ncbi:unnamed protein product [Acanthoscelides obtectus]|uniref:HAT C-terminal dimerisation domain-containing protein n=1 Tax=Acanthoscelides obtectus TaxID=200917 RepID=A0A9P0MMQ3_ACAOB|nr:unnamed protein product [Acanthoscelides obtectus]CAK1634386.1 hypothetical protein AOBTE_LOCUS8740 [Acanthoscelides obtectus]
MPASSAATERSFSIYGFIHSSRRNRLTAEGAGKVTFIAPNLKLLDQDQVSATSTRSKYEEEVYFALPAEGGS